MITGKTKMIGILGWPVEHSLSPIMHNAAFAAADLDYAYVPLPVKPCDLPQAIDGLKAMGFIGVNVTIPHKVAIMSYLDEIDRSAKVVGAVNTIVIQNGRCIGHNTDAEGFIRSLESRNVTIANKKAVLLGAGGAARAVVAGLLDHGITRITVATRDISKAEHFIRTFPQDDGLTGCTWYDGIFSRVLTECDILINCTPVGMSPHTEGELPIDWSAVNPSAVVCDLIYNPPHTRFLANAAERGHIIINGQGMLIEQGALAFKLWTSQWPSYEVMCKVFNLY